MRLLRILPVLFLFSEACIDPLVVNLPATQPSLVVDGLITDAPGPYEVKLVYASEPDTATLKRPKFATGASVWIIDDSGQSELLSETRQGIYQTSPTGIRGQAGKSYYLRIVTAQKTEYQSQPQVLSSAGEIDRLYVEFNRNAVILNNLQPADAFSILVDVHRTEESPNRFRWRWTGTYKGKTFPELHEIIGVGGPIPDPLPCSGYVANNDGIFPGAGPIRQVAECTCCICWTSEVSTNSVISDNRFAQDRNFNHVEVARLQITPQRFYEKYYVEVEQLSISAEVYEFWKLVRAQQQGTGSLFQPNSVKVRGNLTCITDPEKEVLGVFSVSGITKRSLFIQRSEVPFEIPELEKIPYDCMDGLHGGGTIDKPPFW